MLSLIKEGLSNREIAERLEISLAGAKFHVSEIIGKLGVSSREEAAVWQPESRPRFSGLVGLLLAARRRPRLLLPSYKLALASLALPVVTAVIAASIVSIDASSPGRSTSEATIGQLSATEVPATPGAFGIVNCLSTSCPLHLPERYDSVARAAAQASFPLKTPTYIPPGFKFKGALYNRPEPQVSGENVVLFYEADSGRTLTLSQGAPAFAFPAGSTAAPPGFSGYRNVGYSRALWVKGFNKSAPIDVVDGKPVFPSQEWTDNDFLRLGWYVDGTQGPFDASPNHLAYSIAASGLSLDELMRIADSVH